MNNKNYKSLHVSDYSLFNVPRKATDSSYALCLEAASADLLQNEQLR